MSASLSHIRHLCYFCPDHFITSQRLSERNTPSPRHTIFFFIFDSVNKNVIAGRTKRSWVVCVLGRYIWHASFLGCLVSLGHAEDCSSSLEGLQTQARSGRLDSDVTSLGPSQVPLASRSLVGRIVSTESNSLRAEHILFLSAPLALQAE